MRSSGHIEGGVEWPNIAVRRLTPQYELWHQIRSWQIQNLFVAILLYLLLFLSLLSFVVLLVFNIWWLLVGISYSTLPKTHQCHHPHSTCWLGPWTGRPRASIFNRIALDHLMAVVGLGNWGDDKPWTNHGIEWGSKFWDNPETWLTKIEWGKLGNSELCQHFPTFGAHHQLTGMVEPNLYMTDWKAWDFWFHGILFCVYSTHSTHSTRIRNSQPMGIRWFLDTRTRSSVRGLAAYQTHCSVASSP